MRALEKDRTRRYETVNALAADVQRHLDGDAVEACPPSRTYHLRKFVRRNRAAVATAAGVVFVLATAGGISTWSAVRASRAERFAEREARASRTQAAIAEAVNAFLNDDVLGAANPLKGADSDLKLRSVLDRASGRIEGRFADQPLVEASLRQTLGATYQALGVFAEAEKHLRRALELRR